MGSSGGDSGAGSMAMMMGGSPMPGLPVAGKDTAIDPYKYGQFQNFLPDIQAEGQNPMATGLRPDMFKYRSPNGTMIEGGGGGAGGGGDVAGQIQGLRDELAKLTAGGGGGGGYDSGGFPQYGDPNAAARFMGGGGGGGVMPGRSSAFLPDGRTPVPMQGQYGGTDQYGRGNFSSGPMPDDQAAQLAAIAKAQATPKV